MIVQKYGGSSLADINGLRRAAELILQAQRTGQQVAAVVSAMGDTTDELTELALKIAPKPSPAELDALLSTGEIQSAALLCMMLQSMGAKARSFSAAQAGIFTDGSHGESRILRIEPQKIKTALDGGYIAVIAGFQGIAPDGSISTLGRGGSDTSAVSLAAAMGAERCEIYKDVDGIFTADPRLAPDARLLGSIDFRDMHRLSLCGSQVLHSRSVKKAMDSCLPMIILNSFRKSMGTAVCSLSDEQRPDYAGITRNAAEGSLSLVGKAADENTREVLCRLMEDHSIPVLSSELGDGFVSLQLPPDRLEKALQLAHTEFLTT